MSELQVFTFWQILYNTILGFMSPTVHDNKIERYVVIYQYDVTFKDSTQVCELWFYKNEPPQKKGTFYYKIPVQSDFIDEYILKASKGKKTYETFDSTICEVGGRSAWNKYIFKYDNLKRPVSVKHFKAYWEGYDKNGNPITYTKPQYFHSETIYFEYQGNKTTQITKDVSGKELEKTERVVNKESKPLLETWTAWDTHRYKLFYQYY
ncbi:hypothetical protein AD998_17805 [bacterium 336/3]|nr:hypothetical protein AD998_17805 [bacterium 336/3]